MSKLRRVLTLVMMVLAAMVVLALPALAQDVEEVEAEPIFNLIWVGAVVAFFLPLLISFVKRAQWSPGAKKTLAFIVSAAAGVVVVGVQAGWEFDNVGAFLQLSAYSIIEVYVAGQVIYEKFWKDTALDRGLTSVGSA